jgi:hypothetical protein
LGVTIHWEYETTVTGGDYDLAIGFREISRVSKHIELLAISIERPSESVVARIERRPL